MYVLGMQIKYDTKVTATSNGSVKLVRRDRTVMQVQDLGRLTYNASSSNPNLCLGKNISHLLYVWMDACMLDRCGFLYATNSLER